MTQESYTFLKTFVPTGLAIPMSCSLGGTAVSTPSKVPSKSRSKDVSQKKLLNSHKPADSSGAKKEKDVKMAAHSDKVSVITRLQCSIITANPLLRTDIS